MKAFSQFCLSMVLALLVLIPNANAQTFDYVSFEDDPTQTRIYTLDNGLTVYLSQNQDKPRIQTYMAVRAGSKNDPAGQ